MSDDGARELLTVSFADVEASICGQARLLISPQGASPAHTLVAVFADGRTLAAVHASAPATATATARTSNRVLAVGPLSIAVHEPHARWSASFAGADGGEGAFELELTASSPPARFAADGESGRLLGLSGEQQVCRVSGTVTVSGQDLAVAGPGQCGHAHGAPRCSKLALARELDGWLTDGSAISLRAARPAGARELDAEGVDAFLVDGESHEPEAFDEARLSTAYDATGRQRRMGLELWPREDSDFPRRAAGETLCATTVTVDGLRWDCAFLDWRMEAATGIGPYSILRVGKE